MECKIVRLLMDEKFSVVVDPMVITDECLLLGMLNFMWRGSRVCLRTMYGTLF